MYTATAGLMFDTPEDAARAADLLQALFDEAQARQSSYESENETPGDALDSAKENQGATKTGTEMPLAFVAYRKIQQGDS